MLSGGRELRSVELETAEYMPTEFASQSLDQPDREQKLCTRCASIDLDGVFKWAFKETYIREVGRLGRIDNVFLISDCVLCRLFASMRPASPEAHDYKLMAFSSKVLEFPDVRREHLSPLELGVEESVLLGLVPTTVKPDGFEVIQTLRSIGYICSVTRKFEPSIGYKPSFRWNLLESDNIDFEMLRGWLQICQENHTRFCGLDIDPAVLLVPFLRVIDCDTRAIVPVMDEYQYLALSYVWGPSATAQRKNEFKFQLPDDIPNLIQDAITVTQALGFRYLWVDYYCIDQNSEREKATQIMSMGLIYEKAHVTIVAAVGKDPSLGLPGVGNKPRLFQPRALIGKHTLISSLPDPKLTIMQSVWMTRGWTYQEALLSRRLLIFTQHQVYFECRSMHCKESVKKPLRELHTKDMQQFKKFYHPGIFFPILKDRRKMVPWRDFPKVLSDYSKRTVSHPSDRLNAVLGILQVFEQTTTPTYHYFGVPILPPIPSDLKSPAQYLSDKQSLARGFATGLRWDLVKPSQRCPYFPSWSWAGWNGVVDGGMTAESRYYSKISLKPPYSDISFRTETKNGHVVEWDDLMQIIQTKSHDLSSLSPILTVEAYTIKLRFDYETKSEYASYGSGYYWKWPNKEWQDSWGLYYFWYLSLTIQPTDELAKRLVKDEWEAIVLNVRRNVFMVIDWKDDGVAERIGLLTALNVVCPENHAMLKLSKRTIRLG